MATASPGSPEDECINQLQACILAAVHYKYGDAVRRAVAAIRDLKLNKKKASKGRKQDWKQSLDFLPMRSALVDPKFPSHSPLMLACEEENIEMVKLLLEKGASAAFKNKDGLNALHIACNIGNLKICKQLLCKAKEQNHFGKKNKYSSDLPTLVNAKQKRGWTPLMYAAKNDKLDLITELIATEALDYAMKNKNFLHIACDNGSEETLKYIIDHPPPLIPDEQKRFFMGTDEKKWNILHHACSTDSEIDGKCLVEWLLVNIPEHILNDEDKSELLRQKTNAGYSPLLVACEYQKLKTVKYLASRDDVDVSDFVEEKSREGDGVKLGEKSALHVAAIHDSYEIARVLIERGCKFDRVDSKGDTALHIAKKKLSENVEDILELKHGSELLNIQNKEGKTPSKIEAKDVIPLEIEKQGPEMVTKYRKALREGKVKIPRCSLLFLGQARKGKTSLYKLLVGKDFDPKQDSTRGIDNNEVSTVDSREITIEWREKSKDDQVKERENLHALAIIKEIKLPDQPQKKEKKSTSPKRTEKELLGEIDSIIAKIAKQKVRGNVTPPLRPHVSPFHEPVEHRPRAVQSMASSRPTRLHTAPTVVDEKLSPMATKSPDPPKLESPKLKSQTAVTSSKKTPIPSKSNSVPPSSSKPQRDTPSSDEMRNLSAPVQQSASGSSYSDVKSISKALKQQKAKDSKPSLRLNVLDFAGQKNYRPMHHCFITRRAMYLVVFNLQDMHEYVLQKERKGSADDHSPSPVEEIRYWLHSIHAHIYPPDPEGKIDPEDKRQRRVILVGTHRSPGSGKPALNDADLDKINVILKKYVLKDERCVNHLRESSSGRYFVAVENSQRDEESGGPSLQSELTSIASKLEFLDDEYPVSWLRLERKLMQMQSLSDTMCFQEGDIISIAKSKGVSSEELGPKKVLEFLHDTGKIILLRRVPTLFVSQKEIERISNLVIIDPKWLISAMQAIMELDSNDKRITGEEQQMLQQTGKVSFECLEKLWSSCGEYILKKDVIDAQQLCLILQAYCLIHPSYDLQIVKTPQLQSPSSSQYFLVPSLLPEADDLIKRGEISVSEKRLPWISFYFDFDGFLPSEIYHRLVCLLLAEFQKTRHPKAVHYLSRTLCRFDGIRKCNWKVELEEHEYRLKVSVIIPPGKLQPSECIKLLHSDFLKRICKESGLQGVRYHGGALSGCACPDLVVLDFVFYDEDKEDTINGEERPCPLCLKSQSIDTILNKQADQLFTATTIDEKEINLINVQEALKDIPLTKSNNGNLGRALKVPEHVIDTFELNTDPDDKQQVRIEIIKHWMKNQPNIWSTLIEAAELLNKKDTARKLTDSGLPKEIPIDIPSKEIGQISVDITNAPQLFCWNEYGLNLAVPENSLPLDVNKCVLRISVFLSAPFEITPHTLVSAVYSIECEPDVEFKQNLCIKVQHSEKSNSKKNELVFLRAHYPQSKPEFKLELMKGDFPVNSCYGSLQVKQFSWYAVVWNTFGQLLCAQERRYCAMLFHKIHSAREVDIELAVCQDLQTHVMAIRHHMSERDFVNGPLDTLTLNPQVKLDIDIEDVSISEMQKKWKLTTLNSPTLKKERIDCWSDEFSSNSASGVFPALQLKAVFDDTMTPVCDLSRRLTLTGAPEEDTWLQLLVTHNSLTGSRLGETSCSPTESHSDIYRIMTRCSESVVNAMAQDPKALAMALLQNELITSDVLERTVELVNETKRDKGRRLYSAVLSIIEKSPRQFEKLFDIFSCNKTLYDSILTELGKNYV